MTNHIAVGIIQPDKLIFSGGDLRCHAIGDLPLSSMGVARKESGRREFPRIPPGFVKLSGAVAIKEIGHMPELLSFADRQLMDTGAAKQLAHRAVDRRRADQVGFWDMQVAVILHHSGVTHLRTASTVKF